VCAQLRGALPLGEVVGGVLEAVALVGSHEGACEAKLFELLGVDAFETMVEIVSRSEALSRLSVGDVLKHSAQGAAQGAVGSVTGSRSHAGGSAQWEPARGPSVGGQFTIKTRGEIDAAKRQRKDQQRQRRDQHKRGNGGDAELEGAAKDWLLDLGFGDSFLAEERALGLQGGEARVGGGTAQMKTHGDAYG
jgi:hypothetical protein